jgi:hypothetical protein
MDAIKVNLSQCCELAEVKVTLEIIVVVVVVMVWT